MKRFDDKLCQANTKIAAEHHKTHWDRSRRVLSNKNQSVTPHNKNLLLKWICNWYSNFGEFFHSLSVRPNVQNSRQNWPAGLRDACKWTALKSFDSKVISPTLSEPLKRDVKSRAISSLQNEKSFADWMLANSGKGKQCAKHLTLQCDYRKMCVYWPSGTRCARTIMLSK